MTVKPLAYASLVCPDRLRKHAGVMRTPSTSTLALAISLALSSMGSQAIGLGAASTNSHIGSPLRVEIPLQLGETEKAALECFRLGSPGNGGGEDIPWLTDARLSLDTTAAGPVLVVTARASNHPALMLAIRVECGAALRREYALLLNPPSSSEAIAAPAPVLPAVAPRAVVADNTPVQPAAVAAAPAVPPAAPRPVARRKAPAADAVAPQQQPAPVARPAKSGRDRLVVNGGLAEQPLRMSTTLGALPELSTDQRKQMLSEMQMEAALDEKIASQYELTERLRQLEAVQARLRDESQRIEAALREAGASVPAASAPLAASAPVIEASAAASAPAPAKPTPAPEQPWYRSNIFLVGVLAALGVAGALLLRRRQKQAAIPALDGDTLPLGEMPAGDAAGSEALVEPLTEADIWPDAKGKAPAATPSAGPDSALGQFTATGLGPASLLQIVENDVEEHDSAVELADIMMSFGRVQGAAQTLAEYIRANPKQAVRPWIKLLEVYRAADMRSEFEALSSQLNKTFNVKTVAWEDFESSHQTPESLEAMPHIMSRLYELWGTRACQVYLHDLLRDNRQGTRQGFPLAIIDEILSLLGLLEVMLGAYRPGAEGGQPAAAHTQPLTVAPPTQPLNVPPIMAPEAAPAPANSNQLDFDLDLTDLSKTLHINLDELDAEPPAEDAPNTPAR